MQTLQGQPKNSARELVFEVIEGAQGEDTLVFIPAERARELAQIHSAMGTAETWGEFAKAIPAGDWQEVVRYFDGEPPKPRKKFQSDVAYRDGDWPDWPEQKMMEWLPRQIWKKYGKVYESVLNAEFLVLDPQHSDEIISGLEAAGFTCRRDEDLVRSACGR